MLDGIYRWEVLRAGILICLLFGLQNGCSRVRVEDKAPHRDRQVIQTIGSDTMVNLAQAWAEEYAQVDHATSVEVSGGGSGTGIAALINGTADIANTSRRMDESEIGKAREKNGVEPMVHVVGYDALAIFVHRENPLEEITIEQLAAIYSENGPIHSWPDLGVLPDGCRGGRMILISRQSNSGTYHYFREAILGKGRDFRLGTLDLHGSKDVVELVGRTPCAIGYSGMGYATSHVKMLRVARRAGDTAYAPNVENTQKNDYPISRPLYMYTLGEGRPAIKRYFDWIYSGAGQQVVLSTGYVPLPEMGMQSARAN